MRHGDGGRGLNGMGKMAGEYTESFGASSKLWWPSKCPYSALGFLSSPLRWQTYIWANSDQSGHLEMWSGCPIMYRRLLQTLCDEDGEVISIVNLGDAPLECRVWV